MTPVLAAASHPVASVVFDVLVAAHVASAVLGFGALMLTGVYGFASRRPSAGDLDEARRYFAKPARAEWLVVAVPFLGLAALVVQPGGRGPGQLWALLAAAVWLVAAATLLGVVRPAERRLRAALAAGAPDPGAGLGAAPDPGAGLPGAPDPGAGLPAAPDPAAVSAAATRLGWAGIVTDAAFVVALLLMVFQPR